MNRIIAANFDSSELLGPSPASSRRRTSRVASSPLVVLRAFARAHDSYVRARDRFNEATKSAAAVDPTFDDRRIVEQLARLEARYEPLILPMIAAQSAAIATLESLGASVNSGGVKLDGRLFMIVHDEAAENPSIHVVELDDVVELV